MRTKLTKIDGSIAIILPSHFVRHLDVDEDASVEIELLDDHIVIRKTHPARQGWAEAFTAFAAEVDEPQILPDHLDSEAIDLI